MEIFGMVIKVYDNKGKIDRYTVVIGDDVYAMSDNPLDPQGTDIRIGRKGEFDLLESPAIGESMRFDLLPEQVKRAIARRAYQEG
jgi:hypothetical protein